MNRYRATVRWHLQNGVFLQNKYSRKHRWYFDGGLEIPASASPHHVPESFCDLSAVDPEEAFVASISSCHMLWFLSLASRNNFIVEKYEDKAEGIMQENQERKLAITEVILRPVVQFEPGKLPDRSTFDKLHEQAHNRCFIAQSVKTEITIDAQLEVRT